MANLNPSKGREQKGLRPVLIASGNAMNDHLPLCIIYPLTTQIKNFIGDIILEANVTNGLSKKSEVLIFQIRTIAKERLKIKLGEVSNEIMKAAEDNLVKVLNY